MDGWNRWMEKKIFLRTNKNRVYSGIIKDIQDIGDGLIFLSLIDKFGNWITITTSEISEIKEEE